MRLFLLNILLAVLWMFLWAEFDIYSLAFGFFIGYILLGVFSKTLQPEGYGAKGWQLISFLAYFIRILIKSNWTVAKIVMRPRFDEAPRIVRYGVEGLSDGHITMLANAITLTPGTLSIDVSEDRRFLYVHCMSARDRDAAIRDLYDLHGRMRREVFE